MRQRKLPTRISRRLGAALLAGVTLWTVSVTAGSTDAAGAWQALKREIPVALLRWQLGDPGQSDGLSAAAVLTLSQSPLLFSARQEIAGLRQQTEETPEETVPAPVTQPVQEEPQPAPVPAGTDNGVPAKTLVPTDPSGYTVCGRVYISNSTKYTLTGEELLKPFAAELTGDAPQILILHSHGSEGYTPAEDDGIVWSGNCRTTDSRYNVVRMGDAMAEVFGEAGISVLHDRTLYDDPLYEGAYGRSVEGIEGYLEKYPSLTFILDIHRDAVEDAQHRQYKLISLEDPNAAQLSFIMGSNHDGWQENLKLAVAVAEAVKADYPTVMRPITLRNSNYNQHKSLGSMLVEVGAAGNSLDEALNSARIFADGFARVVLATKAE